MSQNVAFGTVTTNNTYTSQTDFQRGPLLVCAGPLKAIYNRDNKKKKEEENTYTYLSPSHA